MVIPRSFFGMLLMGAAVPLAIASAVRPTKVILVPRQQAATDQPSVTGYDWNEFLECTSLMEDVASKIQPTPPPEIPLFWFHHPLVEKMKEEESLADPETMKPEEWCSIEWWRDTLVPNEKEDGKELVQQFKSWTEHTKEIKSKYRSSVYSIATKCAHMSTLPGDIDVAAMAGWMMSAVATNEQECASARSIMATLTTVDGFSSFGAAAAAATTGSDGDAASTSTSTAGAWRGRETGAAVAVVAGIVGAVVGL